MAKIITLDGLARFHSKLTSSLGRTMEMLWINASPLSNFSAQTITLSDSLANYDAFLITYLYRSHSRRRATLFINNGTNNGNIYQMMGNGGTSKYTRRFTIPTDTTLTFTTGYTGSDSAAGQCVPEAVYGIIF